MLEIEYTDDKEILRDLKYQIFVRELIESTTSRKFTWSRKSPTQFITIHVDDDAVEWKHFITRANADLYVLDTFKNGYLYITTDSSKISLLKQLFTTILDDFTFTPEIGNLTGPPTFWKKSAGFSAASNQYLNLPHADQKNLNFTSSFSILGWVLLSTKTTNRNIVEKGHYKLYYDQPNDKFRFQVTTESATSTISATSFGSPGLSHWYFIRAWYNEPETRLGIQINNGTIDSITGVDTLQPGTADFKVGSGWDGRIEKLAIFEGVVLSPTATYIHNNARGLEYKQVPRNQTSSWPINLVSWWEMNEELDIRYDSHLTGNHLNNVNGVTRQDGFWLAD